MLTVVSAIVAFNGWPGAAIAERVESVVVGGEEDPFALQGPSQVALDAAPAAAAVASQVASPSSVAVDSGVAGLVPAGGEPGPTVPPTVDSGGPAPPVEGPIGPPATALDPPLIDTPDTAVPDVRPVTERVLDGTGDAIGPLGDQLGLPLDDTLSDTGRAVTELLDGLTGTRQSLLR